MQDIRMRWLWLAVVGLMAFPYTALADQSPSTVAVITNETGAHLGAYFRSLADAPEVGRVVLADPDGNAEALARELLDQKLTAVYTGEAALYAAETPVMALITMEAREAPRAIRAALEAGCHVLAEKPACLSAEDFEELVTLAESKKRHLMLALANRLNPEIQKAKELVEAGALGRVYALQMNLIDEQSRLRSTAYQQSWFADRSRAGGGHLTWLGIHGLDLTMYVTGSTIRDVAGFVGNIGGEPVAIEDGAALSLRYGNGAVGTVLSGYFLDRDSGTFFKVWGAKGWLEITSERPRQVRWFSTAGSEPVSEVFDGAADHSPYGAFVRACVRASRGEVEAPITGRECLRVLQVIFGAYGASDRGKTVTLE